MWKTAGILLMLLCAGLVGYIVYGVQVGGIGVAVPINSADITYADMVAISLTVFGVIIAVASIALAVAGIIGWNSIEAKAMNVAEAVTKSNLNDVDSSLHRLLKEAISDVGSPLHATLKAEVQNAMFAGVQGMENDQDELGDLAEDSTAGNPNAK